MVAHGVSRGDLAAGPDQPGGRHIERRAMVIEVSPSGLCRKLLHLTHGSRRGLPSAALRAEERSSTFIRQMASLA